MTTKTVLTQQQMDIVRNTLAELDEVMKMIGMISQDIHDAAEMVDAEEKYPFKDSLKDTALDVKDWVNAILKGLDRQSLSE
jgi:hypothetical protein